MKKNIPTSPPVPSGYRPIASLGVEAALKRLMALPEVRATSESRDGLTSIPGAKGTGKSVHNLALNVTIKHNYNKGEWCKMRYLNK